MTPSKTSPPPSILRWACSYLRPHRGRIALLAALSLAEIGLRVLSPWSMKAVVDHALGSTAMPGWLRSVVDAVPAVRPDDRGDLLITFVAIGLLLQLAHQLVMMFHGRTSVVVAQGMVRDLREQLFGHLQALTLTHHARTPTGDAVHRLEADARCLEQIVFRGIFPLVFSALTLVVMFSVLVAIHPPLAAVSMAIVPPLYVWLKWSTRRMAPRADRARELDSRLSERLYESFATIRLIKSHAREDVEQARFSGAARDTEQAWIRVGHQGTTFSVVVGLLTLGGTSIVLLIGGASVLDGSVTLGTLLLVLAYLGFVYGPLSAIAHTTNELQQAFASARRVRAAFALEPEHAHAPGALDASAIAGEVRFAHVSFAYEPGRTVLDDVSFSARPGELVAIVGPSGSGKTTLVSLIVRFHDKAAGRILIDGVDVDRYELRSLRQRVAIVLQDAIAMSGTILDNLRYGRLAASDGDVERAARAANAHEFIMRLPEGYHTRIGEAGAGLSGGQRQRLSIARAFLKDAPILILDEPTAALDTISETQVVDALRRLRAGRTTFVIAHRLSTVRDADKILVLDAGRIAAEGTHDDLLASSPLYRRLAAQLDGGAPGTDRASVVA